MDYRPGIKMLAMPTRESRDRVVEKKLRPMLQGSPVLRRMVAKYRRENILLKDGTSIELATAESPSQRASITVQDLFVDEEDLYSRSGDSSPLEDFKGRTRSYGDFAKIIRACQPKGGRKLVHLDRHHQTGGPAHVLRGGLPCLPVISTSWTWTGSWSPTERRIRA